MTYTAPTDDTGREVPDTHGRTPSDEVTLRLTVSGLYPATRGLYSEGMDRLASDEECAAIDVAQYNDGRVDLTQMVDWFDGSSDISVVVEPDTGGSSEDRYQRKLHRAAKLVGVGDGGEYWSDWEDRARQIKHNEATLTAARDAVSKALDAHPDDLTALALAAALGVRP